MRWVRRIAAYLLASVFLSLSMAGGLVSAAADSMNK
jgi:hypothetical protein